MRIEPERSRHGDISILTKCLGPGRRLPRDADVRPRNLQRAGHPADAGSGAAGRFQGAAMDHERLHHRLHGGADGDGHARRPLWPQAAFHHDDRGLRCDVADLRAGAERHDPDRRPVPARHGRRRHAHLRRRHHLASVSGRARAGQGLHHLGRRHRRRARLRPGDRRHDREPGRLAMGLPDPCPADRAGAGACSDRYPRIA
jgi:hypothetical protein